jgi:tetratricopeptide (TPR) repeat protein
MKPFALSLIAALILVACHQAPLDPKQELTNRILYLEQNMYDKEGNLNIEYANELIMKYIEFTDAYPDDKDAPENLFKAADISINFTNSNRTINLLSRIIFDYNDYEKAGLAQFLQAFVYENQLGDTAAARQLYTQFIQNNPDHNFVVEAEVAIRNLGKSAEDLIREFEEQNQ